MNLIDAMDSLGAERCNGNGGIASRLSGHGRWLLPPSPVDCATPRRAPVLEFGCDSHGVATQAAIDTIKEPTHMVEKCLSVAVVASAVWKSLLDMVQDAFKEGVKTDVGSGRFDRCLKYFQGAAANPFVNFDKTKEMRTDLSHFANLCQVENTVAVCERT